MGRRSPPAPAPPAVTTTSIPTPVSIAKTMTFNNSAQIMKRVLGRLLLIGLVLVLLSCSIWQSQPKSDPLKTVGTSPKSTEAVGTSPQVKETIYRYPEGAELAWLNDIKADEIADILDINRWKFKFTLPKGFSFSYKLELRQSGQAVQTVCSFSPTWETVPEDLDTLNQEIILALQPLSSFKNSNSEQDKLKVVVRYLNEGFYNYVVIRNVIDNPLKDFLIIEPLVKVENDGAFRLFSAKATLDAATSKEAFLVFRIQIEPSQN